MGKEPKKPEKKIDLEDTSMDVLGTGGGDAGNPMVPEDGSWKDLAETAIDNEVIGYKHSSSRDDDENDEEDSGEVPLGKIISHLEDTSLDVNSIDDNAASDNIMPDTDTDKTNIQRPPSKKLNLADTDGFAIEPVDNEDDDNEDVSEAGEEGSKFHRPASIMDLIQGKDDQLPEVVHEDRSLDERLDGKSLEEVLKISQKGKKEWHESKKAEEGLREKAEAAKKRQRKLFIATPLILLAAGVACFYIVLPTLSPPPETDAIKLPKRKKKVITPEELKIDPGLKDQGKLEGYLAMAGKLFESKKYDKAEIVYKKLLPTGWRSPLMLAKIGECRDQLKDKKGAVEFYTKAIAKDYTGDVDIPLRLATILKEEGKFQEIIYALEPVKDQFVTNIQLQSILAETYWKLDMPQETLEAYRRINKQFLTKDQLKVYAELLMKDKDKYSREAFNVYLFLGQNFNDLPSFYEASKIAPDPKLKIAVLTELTGKSLGKPEWNHYNMLLGEAMLAQGQKKEALRVLESIKPEKLEPENALKFLKLVADFEDSSSLMESCENILAKNFLSNLTVQESIRDILLEKNKRKIAEQIFQQQAEKYPQSDIANYMNATLVQGVDLKIKYFEKALALNPQFYSAAMGLGKLYSDEGRWDEAFQKFSKCQEIKPEAKAPRYWMAIAEIRKSPSEKPLNDYLAFLKEINTPEPDILKQMVLLAQYLPTEDKAMEYLKQMEKYPRMKNYMEVQTIRTKIIYGTITDGDFTGKSNPAIKKYRILCLLGEGKINEVMMMPTLKNEFPEYWKVFICWRKNISSWRGNSQLLIFKNPDNNVYILSSKLWQWEISPADAEKQIGGIDYEDRPLIYFMIAERYLKDGNKVKSSIFYQTALKFQPPNIYKGVIKYFKDH